MQAIYLVGFMGCGKSTIGKLLSDTLKIPFYDTDQMIEEKYQTKIKTIFAEKGETVFRDYETNVLTSQPEKNAIIATGGGIIERSENRAYLENMFVIFLETSFNEIFQRLMDDDTRPLWEQDQTNKQRLFTKRQPSYRACADYSICCDQRDIKEIATEIVDLIERHNE